MGISMACSSVFEENKGPTVLPLQDCWWQPILVFGEASCGWGILRQLVGLVGDEFDPRFGSDLVQFFFVESVFPKMRKKWMNSGFRNSIVFSTKMVIFHFHLEVYHLAIGPLFMESSLFLGHIYLFESSFLLQNNFFEK